MPFLYPSNASGVKRKTGHIRMQICMPFFVLPVPLCSKGRRDTLNRKLVEDGDKALIHRFLAKDRP